MILANKHTTVVGMGKTGQALAQFLTLHGANVTVVDSKSEAELNEAILQLPNGTKVQFGSCQPGDDAELIILSPGAAIDASFLDAAKSNGAEIMGETELAFRFNKTPIVAITGTNGKSTVTTLTGQLIQDAGYKAKVGGNLGTPFIAMIGNDDLDFQVLETSSFQLESIETFRPHIAVILNITPDHLDRHHSFEIYKAAKEKIATNQTEEDFLITNLDDPETVKLTCGKRAQKLFFSARMAGDQGAFLIDDHLVIRFTGEEKNVCRLSELPNCLQWQPENVLAALAATAPLKIPAPSLLKTLQGFNGLEHRMEWVRSINGVDYINDSKGTNIGSMVNSLAHINSPVILILGGRDKAGDFASVVPKLKEKVKSLILMGEARARIRQSLNGNPEYQEVDSLEEAVRLAATKASTGDTVLLSPACASFDMFKNYEDRGRQFKALVNSLELDE